VRVLVAGIGNIFSGDDGFGVEVARRLSMQKNPDHVKVTDFGIRGIDLTYALLDGYDVAILVDTVKRGGAPGTLYVIEPEIGESVSAAAIAFDGHAMHPARVLAAAKALGPIPPVLRLVGCEPLTFGDEDGVMGLSDEVLAAIEPAMKLVESLFHDHGPEERRDA
jgi:hydrogenase maturation protease